ncbi:hypothetical protein [Azospirillum argentinense]|uniref:PD(D/E)XK endonuclease domain-containing protein n=1 Tax=Azospirillum brasilense TaxID=192 RepID=A0A4D8QAS6_AZOBR|nr:hypothetical protein [Azospirillum argentinense]QCO07477.1 hypothetical protein D3867_36960 [Azospirillum argentinense]
MNDVTEIAEPAPKKRRDTSLEAAGAEFLVLGHLLLERIPSYKTYTNFPGYDIIATNPERNTSARVQVKSRVDTGFDGTIITNFDTDFVVLTALNRGFRTGPRKGDTGVRRPDFYIFPIEYILQVRDPSNPWGKIVRSRLTGLEDYQDRWDLIRDFLGR